MAIQSPITSDNVVELVGARFKGHASKGFLYTIPIVEFLFKELLILLEILMSGISKRLA